jgi:20S proteasome alpha/beta subunit
VPEGVVLAAESRQVYLNERSNFRVVSDNAQKVFQLSRTVGGLTYGQAVVSGRSILSLVEEYKAKVKSSSPTSVKGFAEGLGGLLDAKWKAQVTGGSNLESGKVWVIAAGYDEDGSRRVFECTIPGPSVVEIRTSAVWKGQSDVVTRLLLGFDPRIGELSWFRPEFTNELSKLNYVLMIDAMTLQDAIDFSIFLIRTTIDMQRFSDGIKLDPGEVAGTGGAIDICVVRPNEGFSWVQKKELRGDTTREQVHFRHHQDAQGEPATL